MAERIREDARLAGAPVRCDLKAIVVEGEARRPLAESARVRRGTEVEHHVGLVEDQVPPIDSPDRRGDSAVKRRELRIERRTACGRGAGREWRAGERLVEQLVAEHALVPGEPRSNVPPGDGVATLEPDPAWPRRVGPELVKGVLKRRIALVVTREPEPRVRKATVLDRPVGKPLPLEALVQKVLVEVEERHDAVAGERPDRPRDPGEVGVVEDPRGGLERFPDDPHAYGVEADP